MAIDLKNFIDGYKTHDVVLGEKKRTFREPSIKQLLDLQNEDDAQKLVRSILISGDMEDLDHELMNLTSPQRSAFFAQLLKELGLA